jgi:hypothetical protein
MTPNFELTLSQEKGSEESLQNLAILHSYWESNNLAEKNSFPFSSKKPLDAFRFENGSYIIDPQAFEKRGTQYPHRIGGNYLTPQLEARGVGNETIVLSQEHNRWYLCNEDIGGYEPQSELYVNVLGKVRISIIRNEEGKYRIKMIGQNRQRLFDFERFADDKYGSFSGDQSKAVNFGLGAPCNPLLFADGYGLDVNDKPIKGEEGENYEEAKRWIEECTGLKIEKFFIGFYPWSTKESLNHESEVHQGRIKTIIEMK